MAFFHFGLESESLPKDKKGKMSLSLITHHAPRRHMGE
jgi:hypothetical protein